MNWKYRVVEKVCGHTGYIYQGIFEVAHDENGEPIFCLESPSEITWYQGESTFLVLKEISQAFDEPILQYDDLKNEVF